MSKSDFVLNLHVIQGITKSSAKTGLKRCNNSFQQTKINACKQLHMYAHSARQVPESDVFPRVEWALARNGQAQKGEGEGKRCVLCPSWHTGEARHARTSSCQVEGGLQATEK